MNDAPAPLDLKRIKVHALALRQSLSRIENLLVDPGKAPLPCPPKISKLVDDCVGSISAARKNNSSVILFYGAHLIKNGAQKIVIELLERGLITHLATNGAGIIHDWELAFLGRTEESVKKNVATGSFGTWLETGRNIHLAILAGAVRNEGFGRSLGRFIVEDGVELTDATMLADSLRSEPTHWLSPARAELLQALTAQKIFGGRLEVKHPWKDSSIIAAAFRCGVPFTVHPGIGYDIISNHPMFSGAAIGRAADLDFRLLGGSIDNLDGGVVLSVGSAIMAPQVFEKSLSCVNNLRLQAGKKIVRDHTMFVVDIQDGGNWDWSKGEPPKDNPAYYLRFCKSFSRMGGEMKYVQSDNVAFLHHVLKRLQVES